MLSNNVHGWATYNEYSLSSAQNIVKRSVPSQKHASMRDHMLSCGNKFLWLHPDPQSASIQSRATRFGSCNNVTFTAGINIERELFTSFASSPAVRIAYPDCWRAATSRRPQSSKRSSSGKRTASRSETPVWIFRKGERPKHVAVSSRTSTGNVLQFYGSSTRNSIINRLEFLLEIC